MVAIDLTGVAFKWLENGTLNNYHYTVATHWPLPLEQFMEIVCKSLSTCPQARYMALYCLEIEESCVVLCQAYTTGLIEG